MGEVTLQSSGPLERRKVVSELLQDRGDLLVVTGLGSPSYDAMAAGDDDANFYLWGGMGSAVTIGLGLSLAQPKRPVLVLTSDGEMLMGLGTLATAGAKHPRNLSIAVLDNERYGETGMQQTHTAFGVDLPGMAAAVGLPVTGMVRDQAELDTVLPVIREAPGPVFYSIKVKAEELEFVLPTNDGVVLKNRMRKALLRA